MKSNGFQAEFDKRIDWIQKVLLDTGAKGIVFGNSGGKDCALTGILCKAACNNTVGIILPCGSQRNFNEDRQHAELLAKQFEIETLFVDISPAKTALETALSVKNNAAKANICPRLRMTVLYAVAQERGYLVAGTGNLSERTMGYFTKWGDGGYDFNPIGDLTATEVKDFLLFLNAPEEIVFKAPSAGLWDGQTDEEEMGLTYAELDAFIRTGQGNEALKAKVASAKTKTAHKLRMPLVFGED